jgi:hypothetical protein
MPARPRKPVAIVRARPTDEPDALVAPPAADPDPATAPTAAPELAEELPAPRKQRRPKATPSAPVDHAPVTSPTEESASPAKAATSTGTTGSTKHKSVQRSFLLRADIVEDLRAAVTALSAYKPAAGVRSISDVINPALIRSIGELHTEYNHGKKFPRVSRMAGGRPPGTTSGVKTAKVSLLIRADILEDLRAAVTYLGAYKAQAGIQSSSDVINPALIRAVGELQTEYNHGKKFPRVSRMPTGRPVRE